MSPQDLAFGLLQAQYTQLEKEVAELRALLPKMFEAGRINKPSGNWETSLSNPKYNTWKQAYKDITGKEITW